jgi:hypothetical protein
MAIGRDWVGVLMLVLMECLIDGLGVAYCVVLAWVMKVLGEENDVMIMCRV